MATTAFNARRSFFDRSAVIDSVDRATRKVLSQFGAFVMTRARQSIRKAPFVARKQRGRNRTDLRTRSSRPGQPPFSQRGELKRFLFFSYDSDRKSVVVGPTILFGRKVRDGMPVAGRTVPQVLEYGGEISITEYQRQYSAKGRKLSIKFGKNPDAWHRMGKKRIYHRPGQSLQLAGGPPKIRTRVLKIAPRPYMEPAFETEQRRLPLLWLNSVTH